MADEVLHLQNLFQERNLAEFTQILREHPELLRYESGSNQWLDQAAHRGDLQFLEALVDLGSDVNETGIIAGEPEGPILQAAAEGHVEVVRWLLERGAKVNFVVEGKPRCWPLVHAAGRGHLEVVKLLVEHGADIHATWNGVNAITQAEEFGQWEVFDYLKSLGARTIREMTPPDYPRAHKRFLKHIKEIRGAPSDWQLAIPGEPPVTLRHIPASDECHQQWLFTVGLSDHRLPRGRRQHSCSELRCFLPADWPLTEEALRDPEWNWPVEWIKRVVDEIRHTSCISDEHFTIMNGDPPSPLAPNTQLCGWLALRSQDFMKAPDCRWIEIHDLFPIYAEEQALLEQIGHEELVNRFDQRGVPHTINPDRPNMAK